MLCPQKVVLTGIEDKRIILINLYVYSVTRDSWCGDWPVKDLLPSAPVQLLHYTTQKQTNDNQKFAKFVFRQMWGSWWCFVPGPAPAKLGNTGPALLTSQIQILQTSLTAHTSCSEGQARGDSCKHPWLPSPPAVKVRPGETPRILYQISQLSTKSHTVKMVTSTMRGSDCSLEFLFSGGWV